MIEKKYGLWLVVDGQAFEVLLTNYYTEQEAEVSMNTLKKLDSGWFGLTDGAMICVNKENCNFYFMARPV